MIEYVVSEEGSTRGTGTKQVDLGQALLIANNFRQRPNFVFDDKTMQAGNLELSPYYAVEWEGRNCWINFANKADWLRFITLYMANK